MKNYVNYIALALVSLFLPLADLDAKGFSSSGGSRSGGFSGSRSSGGGGFSGSRSSTPSASKPSSSSGSSSKGFSSSSGSSKAKVAPPAKSSFDIAQQRRSVTPPKPQNEYVSDFKAKNAAKYPTTFDKAPAQRPDYIPPTYSYGGVQRPVEYNPQTRSYGFMDGLGQFMIYDAITNIAMDSFKKDEVVYVNTTKELEKKEADAKAQEQAYNEQQKDEGMSGMMIFFLVVVGGAFGVFLLIWFFNDNY